MASLGSDEIRFGGSKGSRMNSFRISGKGCRDAGRREGCALIGLRV